MGWGNIMNLQTRYASLSSILDLVKANWIWFAVGAGALFLMIILIVSIVAAKHKKKKKLATSSELVALNTDEELEENEVADELSLVEDKGEDRRQTKKEKPLKMKKEKISKVQEKKQEELPPEKDPNYRFVAKSLTGDPNKNFEDMLPPVNDGLHHEKKNKSAKIERAQAKENLSTQTQDNLQPKINLQPQVAGDVNNLSINVPDRTKNNGQVGGVRTVLSQKADDLQQPINSDVNNLLINMPEQNENEGRIDGTSVLPQKPVSGNVADLQNYDSTDYKTIKHFENELDVRPLKQEMQQPNNFTSKETYKVGENVGVNSNRVDFKYGNTAEIKNYLSSIQEKYLQERAKLIEEMQNRRRQKVEQTPSNLNNVDSGYVQNGKVVTQNFTVAANDSKAISGTNTIAGNNTKPIADTDTMVENIAKPITDRNAMSENNAKPITENNTMFENNAMLISETNAITQNNTNAITKNNTTATTDANDEKLKRLQEKKLQLEKNQEMLRNQLAKILEGKKG